MVGNGYVGIYTDTTVLVLWYPLVGKFAHLCRVETYLNSPCPQYWASYGVVSQLVFTLGWVGMSCFGDVSGSCAVCYGG